VKYNVGKFPFMANSRARTNDDADGLVKVWPCSRVQCSVSPALHVLSLLSAGPQSALGRPGLQMFSFFDW
jgi:hypothetical protein